MVGLGTSLTYAFVMHGFWTFRDRVPAPLVAAQGLAFDCLNLYAIGDRNTGETRSPEGLAFARLNLSVGDSRARWNLI